jgi:hypothetical protein
MTKNVPSATPPELILVVEPKAELRVRGDKVISLKEGVDVTPLADLISNEHIAIRPLFGVSEEWLKDRTAHLDVKMGEGQRLDLSIFYKITAPYEMLADMAALLREIPFVQSAYIKPGAELTIADNSIEFSDGIAPGNPTGDFTARQVYLNDALEGGVGASCAWAREGGRGRGINIIDAEGAWRFSHEDLSENQCGLIGGIELLEPGWRNHGTAVLGVLGGDRNNFGVTGICPDATVRTVSLFGSSTGAPVPNWSAAAAIRLAADMLHQGDIILIEHHLPGPLNFEKNDEQVGYIPIEWWPCNLAAILYATGRGIIVVEAAGNGQRNLDNRALYDNPPPDSLNGNFPPWWVNPFRRDPIDSGAILVGAGIPPQRVHGGSEEMDRSRSQESNFGEIVDVQGWGDNVVTCGYGGLSENDPDEDRWYTSRFNGTSSAAAMVAGVVGCIQGALRARGDMLTPARARELLRDDNLNSQQLDGPFGTASAVHIGPRPNLCRLLDHLIPPPSFKERVAHFIKVLLGHSDP